jgi:Uma2 family endonuclease
LTVSGARRTKWTAADYDRAAEAYYRRLPLEHFMEGTAQATQRAITLANLAVVRVGRPDLQVYNELLIQYFWKGRIRRVVPDNMATLSQQPTQAETNYAIELEPVPPFWVMEYVSASNLRKDYKENLRRYEQELGVPYYLLFYPQKKDLRLYHHDGTQYVQVAPNENGRFPIPELELELGLLDGWVRYWYRGRLIELPDELQRQVDELREKLVETENQVRQEKQLRQAAEAEVARLQALLNQIQGQPSSPPPTTP